MRIGVLRTQVPFVSGGAERHAANLCTALNAHGHEAVEITVPFKWYPGEVLADHILAAKMLDLTEVEGVPIDLLVGLKFPTYLVPHPNKVFWVIHQHRQAYDMWESGHSDLLDDPNGSALRGLIAEEDRAAFAASPYPIFANSGNVAQRLERFLQVPSTPLYHPPPNAEQLRQGRYGDYLFAPGRINPSKRLELMLRALAGASSGTRLVIAGTAENPAYQAELTRLALELGVTKQVTWLGRVDDETLLSYYAEARAVVFTPQDEDYGYITLEAMLAAKPVITTTDAGGPLEFITHGQEGHICVPTPGALAAAFEEMMADPSGAERMGQAGLARYRSLDISWENVVAQLTGETPTPRSEPIDLPPTSPTILPPVISAASEAVDETPSTQDAAVAQLSGIVAPPSGPETLPFATIEDVLGAYAFEELPALLGQEGVVVDSGLAAYLGTHWTRFLATLEHIKELEVARALDVGVFPPLVFQALLANTCPGVEMDGLWEGPNAYRQSIKALRPGLPDFDIRLAPANSERDPWPYEDESFDLVTGMEILEHLALDPYFFFSEAERVLKPGGHLLLTTPNVVSHRGVWKTLNGIAPYSFGIFVPSGGVYGRHNREYAPPELAELGEAAGFATQRLATFDVYDRHIDPATAELLVNRGDDLSLRGETIFYLAQKADPLERPQGLPDRFYHGDPRRMAGAMRPLDQEAETGLVRIGVTNLARHWWPVEGTGGTCLLAEWIDGAGELRHQHLIQPFGASVPPNEEREIQLLLDQGDTEIDGTLRLHLYQIGVGVMTGKGRAPTLSLPCSEAAFLHLARSSARPGASA